MERCGLDLLLLNRQGFTPQSCLAQELSAVGNVYMRIAVSGRHARAYIYGHRAQRVNRKRISVYQAFFLRTRDVATFSFALGRHS